MACLNGLDDLNFYEEVVREIAHEFNLPPRAARVFSEYFDGVAALSEYFYEVRSPEYLELIRRREWIPHEQAAIEAEWVLPVKKWCVARVDDIFLTHESRPDAFEIESQPGARRSTGIGDGWRAVEFGNDTPNRQTSDGRYQINWSEKMMELTEDMEQKETLLKYELRRLDSDWIGLAQEQRRINQQLAELYQAHLAQYDIELGTVKNEIIALKSEFPYLRSHEALLASALGCSISYAREFKHISGKGVVNRRAKGSIRNDALDRDGQSCVSCGAESNLVVHHIIPRGQGGSNDLKNLATLCEACHYFSHGGGKPRTENGFSTATWSNVEYPNQDTFWDDWIHQDFQNRNPPGQFRTN